MAALWYILVILFKSPLWIAQWLFAHKAVVVILFVVIIGSIALGSFNSQKSAKDTKSTAFTSQSVPIYEQTAPPTLFVGTTPSRIYYIQAYEPIAESHALLTDYYSWDGKVWQKNKYPLDAKEILIKKR